MLMTNVKLSVWILVLIMQYFKSMIKLVSDTYTGGYFLRWFRFELQFSFASASVFLLSSIRVPEHMQELISYQFQHPDASFRIGATLRFTFTYFFDSFLVLNLKALHIDWLWFFERFSILWNFRFQVWHRMEEGAHYHFKVNIDFFMIKCNVFS